MKYLFVIISVMALSSCTKVEPKPIICQLADTAIDVVGGSLAVRWNCDKTKLVNFLAKPVDEKLCNQNKRSNPLITALCPAVTGFITVLGAQKIASDFSCDIEKVKVDLMSSQKLCEIIKSDNK